MNGRPALTWLASTAAVGLWAPGLLLLLGTLRARARLQSLGLTDDAAMPNLHALLIEGIPTIASLVVVFVLVYVLVWLLLCKQERSWVEPPTAAHIPIIPWLAVSSVVVLMTSFSSIGDNSPELLPGFSVFDAAVTIVGSVVATIILALSVSKRLVGRVVMGESLTGILVATLIVVGALSGAAVVQGNDQGNDLIWMCGVQPGVTLYTEPSIVDNNTTFQLLHHGGGFYFLRDPGLNPHIREAVAVPDTAVLRANYTSLPASRTC